MAELIWIHLLLASLQVRLQQLCGRHPESGGSGWVPLGEQLGLVPPGALLVVGDSVLVVQGVFRVLGKLVVLGRLLLEILDLQSPQVKEEKKRGPHRHKQVPLLGLHVCCGGRKSRTKCGEQVDKRRKGSKDSFEDEGTGKVQRSQEKRRKREKVQGGHRSAPPTRQNL